MIKKVILFGGAFDPIHYGHIAIAKSALKLRKADQLWFIPSLQSPLKQHAQTAFEHRAHMIELMIGVNPRFKVHRVEATLGDTSYTIDTVRYFKKAYPNIVFEWLIGSDQAQQFEAWKDYKHLLSELRFIVYRRSAQDRVLDSMHMLEDERQYPASSQAIRQGQLHLTNAKVVAYAMHHALYLDEIVQSNLSKKRYTHVKSVNDLALELAAHHSLCQRQVHLAAMLHDIAKEWSETDLKKWLNFVHPSYIQQDSAFWHQKVGAAYVHRYMHVRDKRVLKAIAHHVEGSCPDPIAQVIYIADKCEPTRGYDASSFIELAKRDLTQAVKSIQKHQEDYINKETKHIG